MADGEFSVSIPGPVTVSGTGDFVPATDVHPGGRPTKYRPEYCETIIELGRMGYSKARMAAHFDVAKTTIDNWAADFPEFLDALSRATTLAQAHFEEKGYTNLGERNFNTPLFLGLMKSMFKEDYQDRSVNEIVGKDNTPMVPVINVNVSATRDQSDSAS